MTLLTTIINVISLVGTTVSTTKSGLEFYNYVKNKTKKKPSKNHIIFRAELTQDDLIIF